MTKNYLDLKEETKDMNIDEARDYFKDFFRVENIGNYEIDALANEDEKEAVYTLFESEKNMFDQIDDAQKFNLYCREAILMLEKCFENPFIETEFADYYTKLDEYDSLSPYKKICYEEYLMKYVDFSESIGNITKAIKVFKSYLDLTGDYSHENIRHISFLYNIVEDNEGFYNFYLEHDFCYAEGFIMLIVVLLKHEDYKRAKEVLNDMIEVIEYSDYIDHIWDLPSNDPKANEFNEAIDLCFDEMMAIPHFFSWTKENKEEIIRS